MTREIWSALWQLQIAITCECIYQRHWESMYSQDTISCPSPRERTNYHPMFATQVRDRLFWDETLRGPKQVA